ncbi:N-acetylglucosaminidase [Bacillus sp. REN16]|uniref:N-acetylglucosaminidase n=1 Tax=Bacillus sp. REN16 TaxID=2887296 RepID=UPI001E363854|nr:SH3 domain-containing protein [Bacillus sp. REN16]MCC3356923.1 SH3 domain-containing protein [Bacillus sp. REN16]
MMIKINKKLILLVSLLYAFCFLLGVPGITMAEESFEIQEPQSNIETFENQENLNEQVEQTQTLVKVTDDIQLQNEEGQVVGSLLKNAIVYVNQDQEGHYYFQFGNQNINVEHLSLEPIDDAETSYYENSSDLSEFVVSELTDVYSEDLTSVIGVVESTQTFRIHEENETEVTIIFGHVLGKIVKAEDKEESESEESSTTIDEVEKEEEEVISDSSNIEKEEVPQNIITTQSIKKQSIEKTVTQPVFTGSEKYFQSIGSGVPIYLNENGSNVKVGELIEGQEYVILNQIDGFVRIHFGNQNAYVRKSSIQPSNGTSIKNLNKGLLNSNRYFTANRNLPVYDNTSGRLVEFAKIQYGETYPVIRQSSTEWFEVDLGGRIGYVYIPHVTPILNTSDKYFKVVNDGTYVYVNQNGKSIPVAKLAPGQEYSILGHITGFVRIKYGSSIAYVRNGEIAPSKGTSIKNGNSSATNSGESIRARQNLVVYDNTSGSLVEMGTINPGEYYPFIRQTSTYWLEVDFGGRIGYVYKPHLEMFFSSDDKYFQSLFSDVNIYLNENGKNVKVGNLVKEQQYVIQSWIDSFIKIQYGHGIAYVRTSDVHPATGGGLRGVDPGKEVSTKTFTTVKKTSVVTEGDLVEFATLEPGLTYPIIRQSSSKWLEVSIGGRIGYIYKPDVQIGPFISYVYNQYGLSLEESLAKQMASSPPPQTDKYYDTFVSKEYIRLDSTDPTIGYVTAGTLNARGGASTNYWIVAKLSMDTKVKIIKEVNGWYQIEHNATWKNASPEDTLYYLNPNTFSRESAAFYQFMKLSGTAGVTASEVNEKILKDKGILTGRADAFIEAGQLYNINEIYLLSHALHETGNGKSQLASGVKINRKYNDKGQLIIDILDSSAASYDTIVYNMYGIGAADSCALKCGVEKAYYEGWTTPDKAIIGGAKFIAEKYVHNQKDTLYKMKWNPDTPGAYLYATDIGWAIKQTSRIYDLYRLIDGYSITFEIPEYRK